MNHIYEHAEQVGRRIYLEPDKRQQRQTYNGTERIEAARPDVEALMSDGRWHPEDEVKAIAARHGAWFDTLCNECGLAFEKVGRIWYVAKALTVIFETAEEQIGMDREI